MINILESAIPVAIAFSFVYLFELWWFLEILKRESESLWIELGSPTLGHATRTVAFPLLLGRFPKLESLGPGQRRRALRLRCYLIALSIFYIVSFIVFAFR